MEALRAIVSIFGKPALAPDFILGSYLTGPLTALIGLNTSIQETLIATDRLFELMDLELEKDRGLIEFTPAHAGDIHLEGVSFKHAGRLPTLQDITLTLPSGKITALVGESGCGKSTLLTLLQRLYLPDKGRILIGEIDLKYFQLASLRRHLAAVPQQTHLLSGTILENLAPGDYQPDMERLLRLCREVGVLEFIEHLPQGFFTCLTENGANLSGGQRQRLALARALYLDAPILLLDEPSSALDAKTEARLLTLLQRLRDTGRTIVIAAHTPAVLGIADVVATLGNGKLAALESQPDSSRSPDKHKPGTGQYTPDKSQSADTPTDLAVALA